ncbi:hypothetical protein DPMN_133180 [Dreissena polymorpha]|uniref:Uncharacterized protein n=1 Tax=Dreissena polymorpha TaxID=45954 RepID=A0A9D4JDR8_DREPO|nr:hypothetical protein DPMN_133180 [Dreissena polymorpha]
MTLIVNSTHSSTADTDNHRKCTADRYARSTTTSSIPATSTHQPLRSLRQINDDVINPNRRRRHLDYR